MGPVQKTLLKPLFSTTTGLPGRSLSEMTDLARRLLVHFTSVERVDSNRAGVATTFFVSAEFVAEVALISGPLEGAGTLGTLR